MTTKSNGGCCVEQLAQERCEESLCLGQSKRRNDKELVFQETSLFALLERTASTMNFVRLRRCEAQFRGITAARLHPYYRDPPKGTPAFGGKAQLLFIPRPATLRTLQLTHHVMGH